MAVPAVRTLAFALRMVLRRILHGVYINTAGLQEVTIRRPLDITGFMSIMS